MIHAPPVEAIALAAALLLLALSVLFARAVRFTGPSRARRILLPALFFTFDSMLVLLLPQLFLGTPLFPLGGVGIGLLLTLLIALAAALVAEGMVFALDAERTPHWLGAGIVAAILLTYAGLGLMIGGLIFRPEPFALAPALVAAAAAIVWWPYLPRPEGEEEPDDEAAEVFE